METCILRPDYRTRSGRRGCRFEDHAAVDCRRVRLRARLRSAVRPASRKTMKRLLPTLCALLAAVTAFGQFTLANGSLGQATVTAASAEEPSGWLPTDLGSTLKLWVKADAGVTNSSDASPPSDGNAVKSATDYSGNGYTLYAGATGPTYKTGIQNSLPVLRFAAASLQSMTNTVATAFDGADKPMTFAVVISQAVTNANQFIMTLFNTGDSDSWWVYASVTTAAFGNTKRDNGGTIDSSGTLGYAAQSVWRTLIFKHTGTVVTCYVDGTQTGTDTVDVGSITFTTLQIGRSGSTYMSADIGEIVVCDTALSDGDLGNLQAYLKAKWATP